MYKEIIPPKEIILDNGEKDIPVSTLKDEFGGIAHIIEDDYCYVLLLEKDGISTITSWWFPEAIDVVKTLPTPKQAIIDFVLKQSSQIISIESLIRKASFIKSAYSVADLLHTSPKSVKYEAGCTAKLVKAMPKLGRWLFTVSCTEKWSKGPYDIRFRLLEGRSKDMIDRDIEISCNCNAWRYNGADYNSMQKDYNERQYSNGQAPNIRDKKRKYLICKHVAACIPIFSNYAVPPIKKR